MGIRVEAVQYHTYNGRAYPPGEQYDADPPYLETLEAMAFVRRVPEPAAATPPPALDEPPHKATRPTAKR